MSEPEIQGTGFNLKTTPAPSFFWLAGTSMNTGDDVKVVSQDSDKTWTGNIIGNPNGERRKVKVNYDGFSPKQEDSSAKQAVPSPKSDGDLETVAITVTNGDGESPEQVDVAVIDGPDGP